MKIEIVGAGVVGCAFGRALLARGHAVQWVDSQAERIQALRENGLPAALPDEPADPCPLYVISVPTPTVGREQDRAALSQALARVAALLRPDLSPTVVIRSTILPGTSRHWAVPFLERASGLRRGDDFRFVYCLLLGELEPGQGDGVAQVLAAFEAPVVRVSLEAAELQKYIHNNFNALKITFFNEMRRMAARMSLAGEVEALFSVTCQSAEGMWNPAYGTRDWGDVSGACLPKDVEAFLGWMQSCDLESPLLESLSASKRKG